MISFSNAKINIGLYVTGKRNDGYHNIESLFFPIQLYDAVEIIAAKTDDLFVYGNELPGAKEANSCLQALQLMKKHFQVQSYSIHLLKNIPAGAGLGGGSGNASAVLQLMNEKEKLGISNEKLENLALQLGSDNAFFIQNKPKYVSGRGEEFADCRLDLSGYQVILIYPSLHQSTAEAYKNVTIQAPAVQLKELTAKQFLAQPGKVSNAFQQPFLSQYPNTEKIIEVMYNAGAIYVSLSGSGSCFYGLFQPEANISQEPEQFARENNYQYFESKIL